MVLRATVYDIRSPATTDVRARTNASQALKIQGRQETSDEGKQAKDPEVDNADTFDKKSWPRYSFNRCLNVETTLKRHTRTPATGSSKMKSTSSGKAETMAYFGSKENPERVNRH